MPGKFKHEDVAAVPRGYRVRTVRRGSHEIRVAFPPGPRRRGKGRVVSILHPVGENPSCPIRQIAENLVNAEPCQCGSGEPATFGGMCSRCAREKARETRERSGQIRRARHKRPPRFKRLGNPGLVDEIRPGDKVTILVPAGFGRGGQEWKPKTGRAVMRSSSGGWVLNMGGAHGTPGLADERNIVKVRKGNPPKRVQVFFDPAIKKFTAVIYDQRFGNLYASGHTKKQAAAALHDRVREYHRSGQLPSGGGYGNPRGASSVYSYAVSLGYPYLRGEGRVAKDGRTWLSRVTKKADGTGPAIFVGYDQSTRKWVIEREENPRRRRRNPDGELAEAEELYREFHGRDPREILEYQTAEVARKEYTALGDLVKLIFITPSGGEAVVEFSDKVGQKVIVASSPNGRQLYLIGGDQDLTPDLEKSFGADTSKDLVDLGDAVFLSYDASKWQTDFKSTTWEHKLGEESGVYPRGFFDKLNRQIFFAGGNYRVERPGIID